MNEIGYTVSELAERLGAQSQQQQDLWLRRLRHWTATDVLETIGPQHTGTGRSRRYQVDALYLAAVLLGLADLGMPIGVIKVVARSIAALRKHDLKYESLWQQAKTKGPKMPVNDRHGLIVLALMATTSEDGETPEIRLGLDRGKDRGAAPAFRLEDEETLILRNLDLIFSRVCP